MSASQRASMCRQQIRDCLAELQRLAGMAQGRAPLVRGSLYAYRRRCGKSGCRCSRGEMHLGHAFSVREGGRSRVVSMAGLDRAELTEAVHGYRELRRARAEMVRTFGEMLRQVDLMERLRLVDVERLKRAERGS